MIPAPPPAAYPPPAPPYQYAYPPGAAPPTSGYPPPGYYPPSFPPIRVPPPPRYGDHLHNGLYLRGAVGFGFVNGTVRLGGDSADVSGPGAAFELAIGGTPVPGLVIGFGMYFNVTPEPMLTGTLGTDQFEGLKAGVLFSFVGGPLIDFYPRPEKGFHIQAAIGGGAVTWAKGHTPVVWVPGVNYSGGGAGFMLGVGYEKWTGREWGLGGLFRINWQSASLTPEDPADRSEFPDVNVDLLSLSLLATLTFH